MHIKHVALFCMGALTLGLHSVHGARMPVEGIAAMVDGTPILFSDLEELRQAMIGQRPAFSQMPTSQQRQQILDRLVDEKVIIAKARQDTTI